MREAMLYERLDGGRVKCNLCGHRCVLKDGQAGVCLVRQNRGGVLYTHTYDKVVATAIDPIEKKPLFHVKPGSRSFSIATIGCNFRCSFCQNWDISQWAVLNKGRSIPGRKVSPESLVETALAYGCDTISFTYSEPTVFFELALDTARIAADHGILSVFVTNGFMTEEALEAFHPYLAAANVDLKSFDDGWYKRVCKGRLDPVLRSIRKMKELGVFVEVTTLVIPGENDSDEILRGIARFLASVDPEIPWHISAFHPDYQMTDKPRTPLTLLDKAYEIGKQEGLAFIYTGNVWGDARENTYCPDCGTLLIERVGFSVRRINLKDDKFCPSCGREIPLVV